MSIFSVSGVTFGTRRALGWLVMGLVCGLEYHARRAARPSSVISRFWSQRFGATTLTGLESTLMQANNVAVIMYESDLSESV